MNRYLCLVANQRAGTTALQRVLGLTNKFYNFSEVFHDSPSTPGSYLEFVRSQNVKVSDLVTGEQARKVGLDYLAYVQSIAEEKIPLLDVKFNSWLVIQSFWNYVHEVPFFMRLLLEQKTIFLFIRRRDIVSQVLSGEIARLTGKWHELEEKDVREKLKINAVFAVKQARLILKAETLFLNHLEKTGRILAIDYEDLYPDGVVSPGLVRALNSKFALKLSKNLAPPVRKNLGEKKLFVANYDEVAESILAEVARFPRRVPKDRISD